jgi:hypothetical protein
MAARKLRERSLDMNAEQVIYRLANVPRQLRSSLSQGCPRLLCADYFGITTLSSS